MLEKLGGRKFLAFILTLIAGILVHIFSAKGATTELVALLLGASATFSAANALITAKTSDGGEAADTAFTAPEAGVYAVGGIPAIGDLKAAIEAQAEQLKVIAEAQGQVLQTVNALGRLAAASMQQGAGSQ